MYRIKRFSVLYDRLFSNSLSDCRKLAESKESILVAHILIYLSASDSNDNLNHWNKEIPSIITDKISLKGKVSKSFSYRSCFENVFNGSINKSKIKSKLNEENENGLIDTRKLYKKYVEDTKSLIPILDKFCNMMDNLKDSLNRTPLRSDMRLIRKELYKFRDNNKINI